MPTPNSERRRINVDLGERGWWLLTQLFARLQASPSDSRQTTVSAIIRLALEELAEAELPAEVFNSAPEARPVQPYTRLPPRPRKGVFGDGPADWPEGG